jgi:hypothetical protein
LYAIFILVPRNGLALVMSSAADGSKKQNHIIASNIYIISPLMVREQIHRSDQRIPAQKSQSLLFSVCNFFNAGAESIGNSRLSSSLRCIIYHLPFHPMVDDKKGH